jgi:glycosyltransferase involved in cell wall biosynthesis
MKVGLNLLHLVPGEIGGQEVYARRLIDALSTQADLELVLYLPREAADSIAIEPWAPRVTAVVLPVSGRSRPKRVLGEQLLLPRAVRRSGVALLHNLFSTGPLVCSVPQVTTIHDVTYKLMPETTTPLYAKAAEALITLSARRSARVLTISAASKRDIVAHLGVSAGKVDVVHLGPGLDEPAKPLSAADIRQRFDLGDGPLVLTVSAKRAHKNLPRLFEAFASVQTTDPPLLVVPGYPTAYEDELTQQAQAALGARVCFLGWVTDEELDGLYRACDCLAFPSLAEGFGLPVLEAMRRGTPVVCSSASSLPEIAGEAALYFNPLDTVDMARGIERVLTEPSLAADLVERGHAQARKFSWEKTATETLAAYRQVSAP